MTWNERAACNGVDTNVFYPDSNGTRQALLICQDCPVRRDCLLDALARDDRWGVIGGMTESEREAVRKGAAIFWPRVRCRAGHDLATVGVYANTWACKQCNQNRCARYRNDGRSRRKVSISA